MESANPNHKFDHEKLIVYQRELAFLGWVTELFTEVKESEGVREERVDYRTQAAYDIVLEEEKEKEEEEDS